MTPNPDRTDVGDVAPQVKPAAPGGMRSRRRFMGAAAGGVGVLLAVQARSALGQTTCQSPSAMISGNTSPSDEQQVCIAGRSPGFWKQPQHFCDWGSIATPPTFDAYKISMCTKQKGQSNLSTDMIKVKGTLLREVFPFAVGGSASLWAVLAYPQSFKKGQLLRHGIAAWLNAGKWSSAGYPLSQAQVVEMIAAVYPTGGTYCPPSIVCVGGGMTADQVKQYIEGTYDGLNQIESTLKCSDVTGTCVTRN